MDLKKADLNLLVILDALLATRSVSRTAELLFMSQPAVSHALARLRLLFGDPILVKNGRGMTPSARAQRLHPALKSVLAQTRALLGSQSSFVAADCAESFTLGVTDYVDTLLLPAILVAVRRGAPRARVLVRHMSLGAAAEHLSAGQIDVAIAFDLPAFERLERVSLYKENYLCVVPKGHRGFSGRGGLDRYLQASHLQVSPSENFSSLLDMRLEALDIRRNIFVSLPRYSAAARMIAETGLVGTLPARLARYFAKIYPVSVCAVPVELPSVELCLFWSERTASDAAHAWLRGVMVNAVR